MNKPQTKIAYWTCFILAAVLLAQAFYFRFLEISIEGAFGDNKFYIAIVLIGAGLFLMRGSKREQK